MDPSVTQFISHIAQCFATTSADNLVTSLPLNHTHPFYRPLYEALGNTSVESLDAENISPFLSTIPDDMGDSLASFLSAVLKNIKGSQNTQDEAERTYDDFIKLYLVYSEANRIYGTSSNDIYIYSFMTPLILILAQKILQLSREAAVLSNHPPRHPKSSRSIQDATRQVLERSMQIATSPMTDAEWQAISRQPYVVGDIIWPLTNILFRIYSLRKLHTQSTELQKVLHNLMPHEEKRFASRGNLVKAVDVCQSYYWRGKLGVVLLDMRNASFWLEKAWTISPKDEEGWMQRRSILIRLIPVNLLLGRIPSPEILETYKLKQFVPLINAFKTGNIPLWRRHLEEQREWLRRRSIWLILFERGELLVWRNLFRTTLKIFYMTEPTAIKNRCPTWIFVSAAAITFTGSGEIEDGTITIDDIIVVVASLIDQSLILGHMSYSHKQLVMKSADDGFGGFPRISQVVPRRVEAVQ
ncbi:hypothetical protein L204_105598 [Cryptococcus depauperatus]|nr:hypothetical protein L204_02636 [Cryptococcus depauperatus CBS 7855]